MSVQNQFLIRKRGGTLEEKKNQAIRNKAWKQWICYISFRTVTILWNKVNYGKGNEDINCNEDILRTELW